jgi:E3 ubiquitin-protein ligase HUWE1
MLGEGSLQMLQQIISHDGGGGQETFRIEVPAGTILHHGRRLLGHSGRLERTPRPQSNKNGREFDPLLTLQRWAEEMKILHGDFVAERVAKLVNHVTLAMLPAAIDNMKKAKLQEEEEANRKAQEVAKAEEEEAAKSRQEPSSTVEPPPTLQTTENQDTPVPADTPLVDAQPRLEELQQDMPMGDITPTDPDAEMVDASEISASSPQQAEESLTAAAGEVPAESSSGASPPERVTVMIHGSAVDITDTGIDPTFLEALPDDMREEVLNQHVRDQQAARIERPPDSQISSEFLDALPPEIRAEIIQQEAMERRRRNDDATRGPPREAAEIDPASFIASLDPTLRQAVLLDQDDGFIQSLPSHMMAEAGAYRDELHAGRHRHSARNVPPAAQPRKYTPQHDAISLLDRAGVAVLVRLLFFPQVLKKTLLFKVLVNLCENTKTRTELFNILLSILQDGTADLAAVDKSFSQMTVRNRDAKPQTPKAQSKQKNTNEYLASLALPTYQMENVPDLIAQRCLEALTYIVTTNELSSLFFLTEHDLPIGLRKTTTKKGKGKEKQSPQTHYPLVLLLNLLDRQSLLRTPAILESVVGLLATVTRPLTSLKDQTSPPEPGTSANLQSPVIQDNASIAVNAPTATSTVPTEIIPAEGVETNTRPTGKYL